MPCGFDSKGMPVGAQLIGPPLAEQKVLNAAHAFQLDTDYQTKQTPDSKGGERDMTWETVIGLETHVELATKTKIFCSCTTAFGGAPNTHCCPVCTGMPGTLPVMNTAGRGLRGQGRAGAELRHHPLPQVRPRRTTSIPTCPRPTRSPSSYLPICRERQGAHPTAGGEEKIIRIHEMHMEEDAGKLVHDPWIDQTRADYNRCGVPLIEIVTEPDFRTAEEVIAYLEKLKSTLEYLGVSDCKMQEGSLRCDVNLSVRPAGQHGAGHPHRDEEHQLLQGHCPGHRL